MKKPKFGVAVFPGSNCDFDAYEALKILDADVSYVWHEESNLDKFDVIVLPGGFSYGDYLRTGAIAQFSPLMKSLRDFIDKGKFVLGICNGFQILLEAKILPGAMLTNKDLKFICRYVYIRVENVNTPFTSAYKKSEVLRIPIAHHSGNYYATEEMLRKIENNGQVVFRYCNENGEVDEKSNPNGSLNNIAGIINEKGNVLGMMPHPERACENILGSEDGKKIFVSLLNSAVGQLLP
ncbi:MAG: phosphoribosylformylglycinamidine synthase subunit PurQ [Actinobacteria bacterium]|nr:phosphoribosylformylglycinamidine synthase subunit PurQ [Actinomycetota bacterium]